tara:strand:+ start:198 stop:659 length:462 start_codon:yes stop_codon:yes gene_type:complete
MKIHEYREMMKYLTRPKDKLSKEEKKEVVKKFYKETEQPKSKPMPIVKYIDKINRLYGHDPSATDEYGNAESATDRIQELDRPDKKKIIKKIIVAEKPRPTIQEQLSFEDYLNIIDPNWLDEEEPKPKVLIRKPRRTAQGIQKILNLHKNKNT